MTKVSAPTFVVCGLGDPKVSLVLRARVADGLLVNIPVHSINHLTWGRTMMDKTCLEVNFKSNH